MGAKSVIMQALMIRGLKYGLKHLKGYMSNDDFKVTVDQVLDRVEDHFKEGSIADEVTELVTAELREYFEIPD